MANDVIFKTSFMEGHDHRYRLGDSRTSMENGHDHGLIPESNRTGPGGVNDHTHELPVTFREFTLRSLPF